MEVQGKIGSSPVGYDVKIDDKMNLVIAAKYMDISGAYVNMEAGAPLTAALDQLVQKLHSPLATEVEQMLVSAIKLYIASQPAVAAPAAAPAP